MCVANSYHLLNGLLGRCAYRSVSIASRRSFLPRTAGLPAQEAQQRRVYIFRVRLRDAMRTLLHDNLARPHDELGSVKTCGREWEGCGRHPLESPAWAHRYAPGPGGSLHAGLARTRSWR